MAIEGIWRDLRHTFRQLRGSPVFTATAVITLALGIGATTAIFTLIQQLMLRSLPGVRPARLWRIGDADLCCYSDGYSQTALQQDDWIFFSWDAYKHFRANTPGFESLAAFQVGEANAYLAVRRAGSSTPVEMRNGEYVSGNFFATFGISAWRGRLFTDADDHTSAPPVAVMSFRIWREKYGADPSVVGATYRINSKLFTVIGVAPPGFLGAKIADSNMPDFWLPLATEPLIAGATSRLKNPRLAWLDLIGRVRPGTNPQSLQAQLQVELRQWLASHVSEMTSEEKALLPRQTLRLTPGGSGVSLMREKYKDGLHLLLLAAVCVLLVACANVANLLLARSLKNRRETAIRITLGAPRKRLIRKALFESLQLALMGGATGIAVAYAGARLILHLAFARPDTWVAIDATPSVPVLLFALGSSVTTGLIFGIAPSWISSRAEPMGAMRGASRGLRLNHGGVGAPGAQKMLVIVQTAASLVLLSAAAVLGQSLHNLEHQNFGFDSGERYLISLNPKISNYRQEQLPPLFGEIEDQLRLIPGVRKVGSVLSAPLTNWVWPHAIRIEGKPEPGPQDDASSGWTRVTPGFFAALGDRLVMGRPITSEDSASTQPVAVINEAFARKFFGKENPIGRHFGPVPRENSGMYEIVGVASNVDFGNGVQPMYFLPEAQATRFRDAEAEEREVLSHYLSSIVIWAPGNPPNLAEQVKKTVAKVDPNLVMNGVEPYSEIVHGDFAQQNMIASLAWLFGALGLVLAAVGLYGVTAYGVEQRIREIGVRMSVGANRRSVVWMVLRKVFWQLAIGLALGIPAAIGAGYLISAHLFGVRPWDARMLSLATALLAVAALVAAAVPARRAASLNPVEALRAE